MAGLLVLLDSYLDNVEVFLITHIVLAPLLLLLLEETGVPTLIPGDAVLGYVGFGLAKTSSVSFLEAFILGLVSVLTGASILFFVARRWGHRFVETFGRYMFLKQEHIVKSEKIFAKYGVLAIIIGRHIPGMRAPITIFAAISGIRYSTFLLSVITSSSIWIILYLYLGKRIGHNLQGLFRQYAGWSLLVLLGVIIIFVGLHYYGSYRQRHKR